MFQPGIRSISEISTPRPTHFNTACTCVAETASWDALPLWTLSPVFFFASGSVSPKPCSAKENPAPPIHPCLCHTRYHPPSHVPCAAPCSPCMGPVMQGRGRQGGRLSFLFPSTPNVTVGLKLPLIVGLAAGSHFV